MTIDQIIGIIGQVATWITVLIVFLTLREMGKQRKSSQKPELIIPDVLIYGYFRDWDELLVPTEWTNKHLKDGEEYKGDLLQTYLYIYNIGFGAAKSIKLEWEFDINKELQKIKDYCYQNSIPIVVNINNDFLIIGIKGLEYMIRISMCCKRDHDYIMPVSVTSKGLETYIPETFLQLTSILIYIMYHKSKKNQSSKFDIEPVPIKLRLTYDDIGGIKYHKEFYVTFNLHKIFFPQCKEDIAIREHCVCGNFEFTERN